MKTKMPHGKALEIAQRYQAIFAPHCDRCVIAGSIRRGLPTVGDIEIVAQPKLRYTTDLFGERVMTGNDLEPVITQLPAVQFIKDGERYKQILLPEGITLDLFLVIPPAQWGVRLVLSTGPAEFNKWIVTHRSKKGALPDNCTMQSSAIWRNGEIIPMPEEADFLEFLGLPYNLAPRDRKPNLPIQWSL